MENSSFQWCSPTNTAGCWMVLVIGPLAMIPAYFAGVYISKNFGIPVLVWLLSGLLLSLAFYGCFQVRCYTLCKSTNEIIIETRTCLVFLHLESCPFDSIKQVYRNEGFGLGPEALMIEFHNGEKMGIYFQSILTLRSRNMDEIELAIREVLKN